MLEALEKREEIDEIWLMPDRIPPHKVCDFLASDEDRINMCRLLISPLEKTKLCLAEFERTGKSYSYDTVTLLKKKYPGRNFTFVCGGDMLISFDKWYKYEELLKAVPFTENSRDDEIRGNLEAEFAADGIEPLYARLKALDPEGAEGIHPNNTRRVIRALEYCMVTGEPFSKQAKDSKAVESPYDGKMLVLSFRDRETLYGRINLRVEQMFADGLLKEAEDYFKRYGTPGQTSVQAIGYKELFPYFEGQCSLDEAKENIKRETRRYAKRQLTWFRREEDAVWLFADDFDAPADLISAAEDIARAHFED